MTSDVTKEGLFAKYLGLLGIEPGPPSAEMLSSLVHAHIIKCPFENISKLYRARCLSKRRFPSIAEFLDGIKNHNFGGTCYSNNYYFYQLLRHLNYDADFCGADMSEPDVHTVVLLSLEGREYLVDVGYGPFYAPLPRDLTSEHRIYWGQDEYVLKPKDTFGRSKLEHRQEGVLKHGYLAKPEPRNLDYFDRVVRESLADSATFMNAVRIERFFPDGSVSLYNHSLRFLKSGKISEKKLEGIEEIIAAVVDHFDISSDITRASIGGMGELKGIHN